MMQLLQTEILDWVNPKNVNLDNYSDDGPIDNLFLEVDLNYLDELYDLKNDYPLAPEIVKVTKEVLSEYQVEPTKENTLSLGKNEKRVPNLGNKKTTNSNIKT